MFRQSHVLQVIIFKTGHISLKTVFDRHHHYPRRRHRNKYLLFNQHLNCKGYWIEKKNQKLNSLQGDSSFVRFFISRKRANFYNRIASILRHLSFILANICCIIIRRLSHSSKDVIILKEDCFNCVTYTFSFKTKFTLHHLSILAPHKSPSSHVTHSLPTYRLPLKQSISHSHRNV